MLPCGLGRSFKDGIHLATALKHGAEAIYSNDSDFDRAPIRRIFV